MNGRERGLRFKGTDFVWLDEGAYGTIFVDRDKGRVRKVYRRAADKGTDHCQTVFDCEWRALEIAQRHSHLAPHVAAPFTRISDYAIVDKDGHNVTSEFLDDACFESAYVQGQFQKIGTLNGEDVDELLRAFRSAGIRHVRDASATLAPDETIDKIIDFATEEIELEW